jgi:predicted HNH restriction endonuclease
MKRITETDLILPTLYLVDNHPGINTSGLITNLTDIFQPIGEDAKILKGRKDTKFSQIVRNLVAHHTIDEQGFDYVHYEHREGNGYFTIKESGKNFLVSNLDKLNYLLDNHFQYTDFVDAVRKIREATKRKKKMLEFDEDAPVFEGRRKQTSGSVFERSKALRNAAIQHYTIDGHIRCEVCGFDFMDFYGEIGEGFIEIHHKKPLFQYADEEAIVFLGDAVNQVSPLCSNCHRIIHRCRGSVLEISELKKLLTR